MNERGQELIDELAEEVEADFHETHERRSFVDFMDMLHRDPYRLIRSAYQYIRDAILHFGTEEIKDCGETLTRYRIFDDPFFSGDKRLVGQERPVRNLFKHIDACAKQEADESIFVLIGPPGTGKSRIFYLMEKGLETYSQTSEGAIYTYNFLFRERFETPSSESLGFGDLDAMKAEGKGSYADLPEDDIYSRIECPMQDNPISLIPRDYREQLLESILEDKREQVHNEISDPEERERELQRIDDFIIPQKIKEIEPCRNCQNIRKRLLQLYDGDWKQVMKHIEVVRFHFSLERGQGIAEVDPGVNVETNLQAITPDENKRDLSGLLKGVSLFEFYGKPACAARGMINYQDIFNKNHEQLQHLLSAVEEKTIDFGDVTHKVDFAIFGSTNIPERQLLEENVMTEGLRDRIEQISVPYLLNYTKEREIYAPNVKQIRKERHVSPHTVEMGALYTVLTRMDPPDMTDWFEREEEELERVRDTSPSRHERRADILEKQREIVEQMDLEQKARLYANDHSTIPLHLREGLTDRFVRELREEYDGEEGKTGRSPRWFKRLLGKLARSVEHGCINPFQLYDAILEHGDDGVEERLELVRKNYNRRVLREVEEAMYDVQETDVLDRVNRYLDHAKAALRDEKVYDEVRETRVEPESYLNKEEDFIGLDEDASYRTSFREKKIQAFAGHVDEETSRPNPREALPGLYQRFKQAMYGEMKSDFQLDPFLLALNSIQPPRDHLFRELDPDDFSTDTEMTEDVVDAINRMRTYSRERMIENERNPRAGYCNDCARKVITYVLTTEETRNQFLEVAPGAGEDEQMDETPNEGEDDEE